MITAGLAAAAPAAKPAAAEKAGAANVVEGVEIARPGGGFLGLELTNSRFVLSFYDAQKAKVAPDVTRAILRWPVQYQPQEERTMLTSGSDGTSLTSPKTVRPPHNFKVFISLFPEGSETALETYSVNVQP
jgi:hypothetical protein